MEISRIFLFIPRSHPRPPRPRHRRLLAPWFKPLVVDGHEEASDELEDLYQYYYEDVDEYIYEDADEDDDIDAAYFSSSSSICIGNRGWRDSSYVRAGRQQARPVNRSSIQNSAAANRTGRRARQALKREAGDKDSAVRAAGRK